MIETGYFGGLQRGLYPETDKLVCVSRKYPWFVKKDKMTHLDELSPSQALLDIWKSGRISWKEYEHQYREEMRRSYAQCFIGHLKQPSDSVYRLMCWEKEPPCHRFILKDIILGSKQS